jgi:hypothetical protein
MSKGIEQVLLYRVKSRIFRDDGTPRCIELDSSSYNKLCSQRGTEAQNYRLVIDEVKHIAESICVSMDAQLQTKDTILREYCSGNMDIPVDCFQHLMMIIGLHPHPHQQAEKVAEKEAEKARLAATPYLARVASPSLGTVDVVASGGI